MIVSFLLSTTVNWLLLALFYLLALRRNTFLGLNRFYLLGALFIGAMLALPSSWWPDAREVAPEFLLPRFDVGWGREGGLEKVPPVAISTVFTVYWAGVLFFLFRFLAGLWRISDLYKTGTTTVPAPGVRLVYSQKVSTPCSFLHLIFVPENFDPEDAAGNTMLRHEMAHVRGLHSLDVIISEIWCILFWFNPLVYWYRQWLRQVHEYLADRSAAEPANRQEYGLFLLQQCQPGRAPDFSHHFFQAPIRQRIEMLLSKPSSPVRRLVYLGVLPLVFSMYTHWHTSPLPAPETDLQALSVLPQFPGGIRALMNFLGNQIQYPPAARTAGKSGVVVIEFIVEKNGKVSHPSLKPTETPPDPELVNEALRVVKLMPRWSPGFNDGTPVRTKLTLPIAFKLE